MLTNTARRKKLLQNDKTVYGPLSLISVKNCENDDEVFEESVPEDGKSNGLSLIKNCMAKGVMGINRIAFTHSSFNSPRRFARA